TDSTSDSTTDTATTDSTSDSTTDTATTDSTSDSTTDTATTEPIQEESNSADTSSTDTSSDVTTDTSNTNSETSDTSSNELPTSDSTYSDLTETTAPADTTTDSSQDGSTTSDSAPAETTTDSSTTDTASPESNSTDTTSDSNSTDTTTETTESTDASSETSESTDTTTEPAASEQASETAASETAASETAPEPETVDTAASTNSTSLDSTVTLEHDSIEIGNPVTWVQTVTLSDETESVRVELPADAEIIAVSTSDGQAISSTDIVEEAPQTVTSDSAPVISLNDVSETLQEDADTKLVAIDEPATGYDIAFETPAPYTIEEDHSTPDLYQKDVTVTHDSALHYTDVRSYSSLPEDLVSQGVEFKLYGMVDGVKTDVTTDPRFAVAFVDTDGNGIVDQMQWTVPQLSEQQFVIEAQITILNVQSYPVVGGEWIVRFTTVGTADLTITAINDTTFGETAPDDLKFLELNDGTQTLIPEISGNSIIYQNYSSDAEGFERSLVLTEGIHDLEFKFGNVVQFAHNHATGNPPAAPSLDLLTVLSSSSIKLDWSSGSIEDGGHNVQVFRCSPPPSCTLGLIATTANNAVTFTDTGLSASTAYLYAIKERHGASNVSPFSNSLSGTTLGVSTSADLSISKSDLLDPVDEGDAITYTIVVTNGGPSTATSLTVTDTLPAGVAFVSATGTGWSCGELGGIVTCTRASLAVGVAPDITITVTAPSQGASLLNSVSVSSSTTDPTPGNNSDSETTAVTGEADVEVSKADDIEPALAGIDTIIYTVTVTNNDADDDATNVVVTDVLPAGVTYVSDTPSQGSFASGTGIWTVGTLTPGQTETLDIEVTVDVATPSGIITNTASVVSDNDQTAGNDSDSEDTTIIGEADVSVDKSGSSYAIVGNDLVYTVSVTNNDADDAATSVVVTDVLPAGVTYVSPAVPDICTEGPAGTLTCDFGSVAAGATESVDITVTVDADTIAGTITNTASVSSTNDQNGTNDSDSVSTTVLPAVLITNGAAYPGFDKLSDVAGRQFNHILTHYDQTYYKVTATNPGQFFGYFFFVGEPGSEISATELITTLPFPFVTQGAEPIKVYDTAALVDGSIQLSGDTPFTVSGTDTTTPSGALAVELADYDPQDFGETVPLEFTGTVPSSGLFAIKVKLDWGLKASYSYLPDIPTNDAVGQAPNTLRIVHLDDFTFVLTGDVSGSETIENNNIFKNDPGFAGLVLSSSDNTPVPNVKIEFWTSGTGAKKLGETFTDENGYYSYYYKHTGKATTYIVKLPDYGQQQSVTLKSNQFAILQFFVS
ncbi:MAG: hypothetical protein ACT4N5_05130, partial [Nitrosopumilaceae archaeon]